MPSNSTRATRFQHRRAPALLVLGAAIAAAPAQAFNSGSTGADGAFAPTVNTEVVLPASGVLNYTSFNIPAGVTVTFKANARNTPVTLLVSGNATIAGTLDLSGAAAAASGTAGDGVLADDGMPGSGGPGGHPGGRGGRPGGDINTVDRNGGRGLGPGGGSGGLLCINEGPNNWQPAGGAGGGFGSTGARGGHPTSNITTCPSYDQEGKAYASPELLPLIGGSGGGGGRTRGATYASGGGGGGGALLMAVSGTLSITGTLKALGGAASAASVANCSVSEYVSSGGGGSGGAIRLVATTLAGNGSIDARGGAGTGGNCGYNGGGGGNGRIRIEAEAITRSSTTTPPFSFATPGPVFLTAAPALRVASIAGVAVADPPTGTADVLLPENQANPVAVTFAATGVPLGTTVTVRVTPNNGAEASTTSSPLAGTVAASTATASITLPLGGSTVQAQVSYTVTLAMGDALAPLAGHERVERITVSAGLDGRSSLTLVTANGRAVPVSAEAMQIASAGR